MIKNNGMRKRLQILTCVIGMLASQPALAAQAASGLPLPRFAALKSTETNVRTGPGIRYPIQYVYRRETLPVEIIDEYDLWRKIRDVEGASGWVHKTMLVGQRTVLIRGKEPQIIRRDPDEKAKPLLKAEPMVIAKLVECEKEWCRVLLSGRKGWIEKTHLWGVYPTDIFD